MQKNFEWTPEQRLHTDVTGRVRYLALELAELRPHLESWNPDITRYQEIMHQLDALTSTFDTDDAVVKETKIRVRCNIFIFLKLEWIEATSLASGLDLIKDEFDEERSLTDQCMGLFFVRAATLLARHNLIGRGFESDLALE